MNPKRIWFIFPALLLPYIVLAALAVIFCSASVPFFETVMQSLFNNNVWYLLLFIILYVLFAAGLSITCFIISLCKKWDSVSLAKTAMIIKLLQIPAYIVIFVVGVIFMITIFTIPFSIVLFFLDAVTLFLTGLLSLSSIINAIRQHLITGKGSVVFIILQFVFVADVISAIIFFFKIRKRESVLSSECVQ